MKMRTNNQQGRTITVGITVYLIIKIILNGILGGMNVGELILALIFGVAMFSGYRFINYVVAAYLAIVALVHLPDNISNISSNWIYLLEGIADIGFAAVLCFVAPVKEHFTNEWQDLFGRK